MGPVTVETVMSCERVGKSKLAALAKLAMLTYGLSSLVLTGLGGKLTQFF